MKDKLGLVLEGGAMRGMFSCGVLDVMMEKELHFDGAVGVSAGACFGCNVKSKQIGRAIRYNLQFCNDPKYGSIRSLITSGDYYNAQYCYRYVPEQVDLFDRKTFYENPMEFHIVTTDIESGEPIYYSCEQDDPLLLEWMRASASLPFFARIVEIEGRKMMDGGISDSIPLRYMEKLNYARNVVILTQPKGYVKEKTSMMALLRWKYRKYPKMLDALARRHEMYNETLQYVWQKEKQGDVLVLCPEEALPISRIEHDPTILQQTYDIGRALTAKRWEEICEFVNS